ncbi:MAG: DNA mismatch repair protein MutS [bacterium]|nr:DNA mismatch repair protein MutS [bacterium]
MAGADTPMMRQYREIKARYQDAILFFRMGDFYEMFFDDAHIASKVLDITLTGRGKDENRVPMCGFPFHSADNYTGKLVSKGYKVAICEQIEDPAEAKGLTKRDVVKVITPGTVIDAGAVDETDHVYLAAVSGRDDELGMAVIDASTGAFFVTGQLRRAEVQALLDQLSVKELLVDERMDSRSGSGMTAGGSGMTGGASFVADHVPVSLVPILSVDDAHKRLAGHFNVSTLEGFGIARDTRGLSAAWAILDYLKYAHKTALSQVTQIRYFSADSGLRMDGVTIKNLELVSNQHHKESRDTLFYAVNRTRTAMGARLLKTRLQRPFVDGEVIHAQQDAVAAFIHDILSREELRECLKGVYDLERLLARVVSHTHNPKDLLGLAGSLAELSHVPGILNEMGPVGLLGDAFHVLAEQFSDGGECQRLVTEIQSAIRDDAPAHIRDGRVIKAGYSEELDTLMAEFSEIRDWIAGLEQQERDATGIKTMKVGYNRVFGYYFEVTNTHKEMVPEQYIRKQTLTGAERYITPELKEKEQVLLSGEAKQIALEQDVFKAVVGRVEGLVGTLQQVADLVAQLDVWQSLASVAQAKNYVRPEIVTTDARMLVIEAGRHPVLEQKEGIHFIANDVAMNGNDARFFLITGPNMAGKSTLMRQVALMVILAQIGSFVPATSMKWAIVDKLFTRIGSLDNLAVGQSTFMVEMVETATILNGATDKSLILLDEIGRGTSTYDGMSIAAAVSEYVHDVVGARAFFATHYHELTGLAERLVGAVNMSMAIRESGGELVFEHRLVSGPADKSYGVHVAKMAGMPAAVVAAAEGYLARLELHSSGDVGALNSAQLSLFI